MAQSIYDKLSEERKAGQAAGTVPEWYITGGYQMFKDKYLYQADSIKEQMERIAFTAAKHLKKIGLEEVAREKFFNLLWKGHLSPSTPVLANMGTDRGLPVSCSGGVIDDSIDGFYNSRLETALLTKYGFGTSAYLGNIRPRGSAISVGGKASGIMPVVKGHIQDMRDVAQGTARRGSWAGYLPIDHGDFDELADFVLAEPDDANVGWIITDEFNAKLNAGDAEAIRRIQKTLKLKLVTGKGYYSLIDHVNAHRPQMYVDKEMYVKASNLCFTGDTLVTVAEGKSIKISELAEMSQGVTKFKVWSAWWNPQGWAYELKDAVAFKTNDYAQVIMVTLSNGDTFKCTPDHRLALPNGEYIQAAHALGLELEASSYVAYDTLKITVVAIDDAGYETVYDLTVEDNHNFNIDTGMGSILVHNCDEITLFADKEHTFTCVLSSMNVSKWQEWKDTDAVYWSTIFLDCVAEEFIEKASKIKGLEKAVLFTKKGRALGLGQCGFHTLLQKEKLPFEEMGAAILNVQIAKHIAAESKRASVWMATELGEPEWCVGYGVRNTHTIAIAPTKSTALTIGGVSEGINPDPAMTYSQTGAGGEMDRTNPILIELMKEKGVYSKKHIKEMSEKQGSVQHVTWLTDEEKKVFKTAFEINQEVVLRLASARAPYIDQWQSLNTFFSSDTDPAWISHIHRLAFNDPNILGLYYVTTAAGVQGSTECSACS